MILRNSDYFPIRFPLISTYTISAIFLFVVVVTANIAVFIAIISIVITVIVVVVNVIAVIVIALMVIALMVIALMVIVVITVMVIIVVLDIGSATQRSGV